MLEAQFCCGQDSSSAASTAGWYSACLPLLAAVVAALALAPAALAGPSLHVGVVEDAAIWGDPSAQMELAQQAGFDTIRMTAQWSSGHTELEHSVLVRIQHAVLAAQARGIRCVIAIYNTGSSETPADPILQGEFVAFARNTAASLPLVSIFVVGNEPNSNYYWQPQFDTRGGDNAAVQYEGLLAQSYDAIKSVRPDATVVGGALDSAGTDDPAAARPTHSPLTFIRDMGTAYRASGRTRPLVDAFGHNPYPLRSQEPAAARHRGGFIGEGDYAELVSTLAAAFSGTPQRSLDVWYLEDGFQATVPRRLARRYTGSENVATVTAGEQAVQLRNAILLAACQPHVRAFFNFELVDETRLAGWQSGLEWRGTSLKPAAAAFGAAARAAERGAVHCPDRP